jgi:hypothetical protein
VSPGARLRQTLHTAGELLAAYHVATIDFCYRKPVAILYTITMKAGAIAAVLLLAFAGA